MWGKIIQHKKWALGILMIVSVLTFINILPNQFIGKDLDLIVDRPLIQNFNNIPRFFVGYVPSERQEGIYSPLRTMMFSIGWHLFGNNPTGWHVISFLIHLLGVWAVYCLTQLFLGNRWVSFLAGLMFAVHPVHVESITAIAESMGTAGIVLGLWAFYWYVRAVLPPEREQVFNEGGGWHVQGHTEGINQRLYCFSLLLGGLAVGVSELMITMPFLILMFNVLFVEPRFSWRKSFARFLPFLMISVIYVMTKWIVIGSMARAGCAFGSPYLTFLVAIKAWAHYCGVLLAPIVLTHNKMLSNGIMSFNENDFDRAAFFAQSWHDPQVVLSFFLLAGIFAAGVIAYRKKPLITFCAGWFYLSLFSVLPGMFGASFYAERYLYSGSWAYCLILAWVLVITHQRFKTSSNWKKWIAVGIAITFVAGYGARTIIRNHDYRNERAIYEKAVKNNPRSAYLANDLGILYSGEGRFDDAEKSFLNALALQPENDYFYFSLAEMYAMSEKFDRAQEALGKAIGFNEKFADAYFNLAVVLYLKGEKDAAKEKLDKAVQLWREEGKVLEAGDAVESFMVFILDQEDRLKDVSAEDLLRELSVQ